MIIWLRSIITEVFVLQVYTVSIITSSHPFLSKVIHNDFVNLLV